MPRPPATQFDHVVFLLPYKDILRPPRWVTDHFVVSPGGRHADGKTENRIILFRDGTYLELVAFVDDNPEYRRGHWWDKPFGVVDFALTTKTGLAYTQLQDALQDRETNIRYAPPQPGGRLSLDRRRQIQWEVCFPTNISRGAVPFWCHDIDPQTGAFSHEARAYRVPGLNGNVNHSCGVVGLAGVIVEVPNAHYKRVSEAMSAITDQPVNHRSHVGTPFQIGRLEEPVIELRRRSDGELHEPHLTIALQSPGKDGFKDIEVKIGDSIVVVKFVRWDVSESSSSSAPQSAKE